MKERSEYQLLTHDDHPNKIVNRQLVYDLCANDFTFFANNFIWIQNPRADIAEEKDIPLLLWDYQEEASKIIIDAILKGYDLPIEKSRDMGLSWLLMAILVWGWHFHQWECLVGSQKAENVDTRGNIKSLLEKARYILDRIPNWLCPHLERQVYDKSMILVHPKHHASIAGESNNTNFGRSDRRKVILFDEFASWELTDRAAWQSCSATTKCRIPLSTPNTRGVNCYFYQIIQDAKKKDKPYLRLHWTLHPTFSKDLYYDEYKNPHSPWYDSECKRAATMSEVSQELDIDYEASMSGKVFGEFSSEVQIIDDLEYNEDLPLYITWDFGLDQTALQWIQYDWVKRQFLIVDEYVNDGRGEGDNIYHYIDIVHSKEYKQAIHFGDPNSGNPKNLTSGNSIINILKSNGINFKSQPRVPIPQRIAAGRNILPYTRVSSNCILTIEMFSSWQMQKPRSGNTTSQVPVHNQYSHLGDAFTYFALGFKTKLKPSAKSNFKRKEYKLSPSGVTL